MPTEKSACRSQSPPMELRRYNSWTIKDGWFTPGPRKVPPKNNDELSFPSKIDRHRGDRILPRESLRVCDRRLRRTLDVSDAGFDRGVSRMDRAVCRAERRGLWLAGCRSLAPTEVLSAL